MRTLYIVRHAKASKGLKGIEDWQRPLNEEGIARANRISEILRNKNICPGKMISSYAFRALNTAVIFAQALNYPVNEIEIHQGLYEKSVNDLIRIIKSEANHIDSIMLFGHNPSFSDLCNFLTGSNAELPTSAVACIELDIVDWKKTDPQNARIIFIENGK